MAQHVRVLGSLLQQLVDHPCAHTFWKVHARLEQANDPFNPAEVDCYPVPGDLRRAHFVHREGVLAFYWEHPDGDVEIYDVLLPGDPT